MHLNSDGLRRSVCCVCVCRVEVILFLVCLRVLQPPRARMWCLREFFFLPWGVASVAKRARVMHKAVAWL